MTKTQEELVQLNKENHILNSRLKELSEDELNIVAAGNEISRDLNVVPDENDFGTDSDKNVLPPDIKKKDC